MQPIPFKKLDFGARRSFYCEARELTSRPDFQVNPDLVQQLTDFDLVYRTLCAVLFNFVPTSGHPGGSISSGRFIQSLLFKTMNYNIGDPDDDRSDVLVYAAGHKALGLYAMWALRNEVCRIFNSALLPKDIRRQLRLEDLLGFRRNPTQDTELFLKHSAKALDGHPTPTVPFVKLATGASGVGVGSAFGYGLAARDYFGAKAPFIHLHDGEGGITPGRTHEAMAAIATAQVNNIVMHLDWNQSSIDSDKVCRDGSIPGDYVQWNPVEYGYFHDWNVIFADDGFNFCQILAAQQLATSPTNDQPTLIVYRTIKGWRYGIEGRGSHGAGHKFCSPEYYTAVKPFEERFALEMPRCNGERSERGIEQVYYQSLLAIRSALEKSHDLVHTLGHSLESSGINLKRLARSARAEAPNVAKLYSQKPEEIPAELTKAPGQTDTLRGALGNVLNYLNKSSGGAILVSAADLSGSTSISLANQGFPSGFWNAVHNPNSRLMALGGICEDGMGAMVSGISAFGKSIGVASSYGAFIAALQHVAARLHGIGQQGRKDYDGSPFNPFILVCAHAGLKTGEDGPTHADPQALQLLQENFPAGMMITLTPWDSNELWPLTVAALNRRPAIIAPFVTRPNETIMDRTKYGLPPLSVAAQGVYAVRRADSSRTPYHGTVILQGSCVMNDFVSKVLLQIDAAGLNLNVYYISSVELFETLSPSKQEAIFPSALRREAMGITGFTLPTMHRWIHSQEGLQRSLHPFGHGRFPGSGQANKVLHEAGLDGEAQWQAIQEYTHWMAGTPRSRTTHSCAANLA